MTSPEIIYALRWLVRDTFLQARANKVFWIMLGMSCVFILFTFSVSVTGGDIVRHEGGTFPETPDGKPLTGERIDLGRLNLFFGAVSAPLHRGREEAVHLVQVILATWVAGAVGVVLTLVWTAGFVPEYLQPSTASVLLSKPVPRWFFLSGKYVGVIILVLFQAAFFFVGTFIGLGSRTGVWTASYLVGIPLLTLHFAMIYSVSVLIAVLTRSTLACVLGSVLFWILCIAVNYAYLVVLAMPHIESRDRQAELSRWLFEKSQKLAEPEVGNVGKYMNAAWRIKQLHRLKLPADINDIAVHEKLNPYFLAGWVRFVEKPYEGKELNMKDWRAEAEKAEKLIVETKFDKVAKTAGVVLVPPELENFTKQYEHYVRMALAERGLYDANYKPDSTIKIGQVPDSPQKREAVLKDIWKSPGSPFAVDDKKVPDMLSEADRKRYDQEKAVIDNPARLLGAATATMMQVGYWIFPKPLDILVTLEHLLQAKSEKDSLLSLREIDTAISEGQFDPFTSALMSFFFTIAALALAGYQLEEVDY
jgi:ABC-type transport system involved in multi-copper enzyme maturation permease subunit